MTSPDDHSGVELRPSDVVAAGFRNDTAQIERGRQSADPAIRHAALGALLRTGALSADQLAGFARDRSASVRRRAAEVAPRISDAPLTEALLVTLLDDEPEIVEVAAFALGEVGSADGAELAPTTIAMIESIARDHDDALCREAAVASLGALHTGLPTILGACRDKATVRRRAIIALAPFEGPEVDQALQTALADRDWQVRQAAEDLIG